MQDESSDIEVDDDRSYLDTTNTTSDFGYDHASEGTDDQAFEEDIDNWEDMRVWEKRGETIALWDNGDETPTSKRPHSPPKRQWLDENDNGEQHREPEVKAEISSKRQRLVKVEETDIELAPPLLGWAMKKKEDTKDELSFATKYEELH